MIDNEMLQLRTQLGQLPPNSPQANQINQQIMQLTQQRAMMQSTRDELEGVDNEPPTSRFMRDEDEEDGAV